MEKIKFLVFTIVVLGCSSFTNYFHQDIENVSMVAVIANPEKYHGKIIRIQGYFTLQFEERAIYLSKDVYDNGFFKNGILLDISDDFIKEQGINSPFRGYVSVIGKFDKNQTGSDCFSGLLHDIRSISRALKRKSSEVNTD